MIRLENVSFYVGTNVFNNINFHLPRKGIAIILGSRVAGKTAFIDVCLGKEPVTDGVVRLMDRKLLPGDGPASVDIRRIGLVTQHVTLMDNLSVAGNVGLPLAYHLGLRDRDLRDRVNPLLEQFGIGKIGDRFPHQINPNEAKLAMLARAMIQQPSLVILDEPTAGDIDPAGFIQVMAAIKRFHDNGVSLLITTCSPSMASLEGAGFYYLVDHRLIPHSGQLETSDRAAREFFKEIRNYTERQKREISGFFKVLYKDDQNKDEQTEK